MLSTPSLQISLAVIGLVAGAVIVYAGPRLAAYRLPEPTQLPPAVVFFPIAGVWRAHYHTARSILVELATAAVLAGLGFQFGATRTVIIAAIYAVLLVAIADVDLQYRLVLNRLSFPGIVLALALSWLWPGLGIVSALLGALLGLVLFAALQVIGRGALGTGDTKLAILIGAMRGLHGGFDALVLGIVLGGLAGLFLLTVLRRGRKEYFAYAPYLAAGAILSFFVVST